MVWHTPAPWEVWRAQSAMLAGLGESPNNSVGARDMRKQALPKDFRSGLF